MGKQDAIRELAGRSGLSQRQVAQVIEFFIDDLAIALQEHGRYAYPDFGVFTVKERAARTGRNPRTGESVQIPARRVIHFKAAAAFVERAT